METFKKAFYVGVAAFCAWLLFLFLMACLYAGLVLAQYLEGIY